MRKPRKETLSKTGLAHKMWRGHNREPIFEEPEEKIAYVDSLGLSYSDDIRKRVDWYSICLMTNHTHESTGPTEGTNLSDYVDSLSTWMRNGHSRFGQGFNRRHDRQGKVAYDRPKTVEVEDDEAVKRLMFYGDCNPVRAGMCSHPSQYRHSSYRFYAYGEKSELTKDLTPPKAYLALGDTPAKRQRRYRQACDIYMRQRGLIDDRPDETVDAPYVVGETEAAGSACDGGQADAAEVLGEP